MNHFFDTLIPQPRVITPHPGSCEFPCDLSVDIKGLVAAEQVDCERFAHIVLKPWMRKSSGPALVVEARVSPNAGIPGLPRLSREITTQAYVLVIDKGLITVDACDIAGLRYGIQTLRQLLENAEECGVLPHCRILDWPRLSARGIHYDLAREMEYRPTHLKKVVERLAYFKMNQLHLYIENKFAYRSCPQVAPPGVMTPRQAWTLCRYAELFGITVIPQVATLGHMGYYLHGKLARFREDPKSPANLCPTHPEVRPWLAGFLADIAEAFRSPYIHIGYDESRSGICRRCRRHGTPRDILVEHLNWLNAEVKKLDAQTMIYGDKFLSRQTFPLQDAANGGTASDAREALAQVNRDIIITNWHYTAPYSGTTRYLVEQGFVVYGVTANNIFWHNAVPVRRGPHWIVETVDRDIAEGAVGAYNCNWELYRGQIFDNVWFLNALAGERFWTDKPHNYVTWGRRFSSRFYGMSEDYYSEVMGLAEVVPSSRRVAFLDCHVLEIPMPEFGDGRQCFPETGEYLINEARKFRKAAERNADSLRLFHMPGEIVRYIGIRLRQRVMLETALHRGQKSEAARALKVIREAAEQIKACCNEAYRVYGYAVQDRERIQEHIDTLDRCLALVRSTKTYQIPQLTVDRLVTLSREL